MRVGGPTSLSPTTNAVGRIHDSVTALDLGPEQNYDEAILLVKNSARRMTPRGRFGQFFDRCRPDPAVRSP